MQHILDELAAINDFYNSATGDPMTIEKSKAALAGSVAYKVLPMDSLSTTDGGEAQRGDRGSNDLVCRTIRHDIACCVIQSTHIRNRCSATGAESASALPIPRNILSSIIMGHVGSHVKPTGYQDGQIGYRKPGFWVNQTQRGFV